MNAKPLVRTMTIKYSFQRMIIWCRQCEITSLLKRIYANNQVTSLRDKILVL